MSLNSALFGCFEKKRFWVESLTRSRPLIRLWCPRSKSNMDDFSIPIDSYVYADATQEK